MALWLLAAFCVLTTVPGQDPAVGPLESGVGRGSEHGVLDARRLPPAGRNSAGPPATPGLPGVAAAKRRPVAAAKGQLDPGGAVIAQVPILGQSLAGIAYTGFPRPNPSIAAHDTSAVHVLTVDSRLQIRDERGATVLDTTLQAWHTGAGFPLPGYQGEARLVFDHFARRFVLACLHYDNTTNQSDLLLSVSQSDDPRGLWWVYRTNARLEATTLRAWYGAELALGYSDTACFVSLNMRDPATGAFVYAKVRAFQKSLLYGGTVGTWVDLWNIPDDVGPAFGVQPTITLSATQGRCWLLSARPDTGTRLTAYELRDPFGGAFALTRTFVTVPAYTAPPDAPQTGQNPLDTADARLTSAVYLAGRLYACHAVAHDWGQGTRAAIRPYRLHEIGIWPQWSTDFGLADAWYFHPSIGVNGLGHAVLAFHAAAAGVAGGEPSLRYTGRLGNEASMVGSAVLKPGSAFLQGGNPVAYGAGTALALGAGGALWLHGEYAASFLSWGTWVGAVGFTAGAVDGTPPQDWQAFTPTGWNSTATPTCLIAVRDLSGIQPDTARFRWSIDGGQTWSAWQPANATGAYGTTLFIPVTATVPFHQQSATLNQVEFRIDDTAGNSSSSGAYTVRIDTAAPAQPTFTTAPPTCTSDTRVYAFWATTDNLTPTAQLEYRYRVDGGTFSAWSTTAGAGVDVFVDGPHTIEVEARDLAGNVSARGSAGWNLDRSAPTGTAGFLGGGCVGSVQATLDLTWADVGCGVREMRVRNQGTATWPAWRALANQLPWTLPAGDGQKRVEVQFQDQALNLSPVYVASTNLDTTPPTGSIVVAQGSCVSATVVTLNLTYADAGCGAAAMRVRNQGAAWGAFGALSPTLLWTLPTGDGPKCVEAQFQDQAGNTSTVYPACTTLDTLPPSGSVTINQRPCTNQLQVTLSFAASDTGCGVTELRVRDAGLAWGGFVPMTASMSWTLPATQGQHCVEVQYRDRAGNVSAAVSDCTTLDTIAPGGSVSVLEGTCTNQATVTLVLSPSDQGCGVTEFRARNAGTAFGAYLPIVATTPLLLPPGEGLKVIEVQYRDRGGNESTVRSTSTTVDTTPPTGTVTIPQGAYVQSRAVTLNFTWSDPGSGCGVQNLRVRDQGGVFGAWLSLSSSLPWTLPPGDGPKCVEVEFRDRGGNVSAPIATACTFLDATPPTGSVTLPACTGTRTVTLQLAADDGSSGSGVVSFRVRDAGGSFGASYGMSPTFPWLLPAGEGPKCVEVEFRDRAGNVSTVYQACTLLDTTPPTGSVVIRDGAFVRQTAVTLDLTFGDGQGCGVSEVRVRNAGNPFGSYVPVAASLPWTLPAAEGQACVEAQFRDRAGNQSVVVSACTLLDTTLPRVALAIIPAGCTSSPAVQLHLSTADTGSGVAEMRMRDAGSAFGAWQPVAATVPWTLPGGDGQRCVDVEVRDRAGNVSLPDSDCTTLDTTAPVGRMAINGGAACTNQALVNLTVGYTDQGCWPGEVRIRDVNGVFAGWQPYRTDLQWNLPGADGTKCVEGELRDAVLHVSQPFQACILLDTTPPTGAVQIQERPCTAATQLHLALTWSDGQGCGVQEVRVRERGGAFGAWQPVAPTVVFDPSPGDGQKTIEVEFRDGAGNVSAPASDTTQVDRTPPTLQASLVEGTCVNTYDVHVQLQAEDRGGCGVAALRIGDSPARLGGWQRFAAVVPWTLATTPPDLSVAVQVRDPAGNESPVVVVPATFDRRDPQGTIQIAGGASCTMDPVVPLTLTWSDDGCGVVSMRLREEPGPFGAPVPPAALVLWTLSPGDGSKVIEVEYRDQAGNTGSARASIKKFPATAPRLVAVGPEFQPFDGSLAPLTVLGVNLCPPFQATIDGFLPAPVTYLQSNKVRVGLPTLPSIGAHWLTLHNSRGATSMGFSLTFPGPLGDRSTWQSTRWPPLEPWVASPTRTGGKLELFLARPGQHGPSIEFLSHEEGPLVQVARQVERAPGADALDFAGLRRWRPWQTTSGSWQLGVGGGNVVIVSDKIARPLDSLQAGTQYCGDLNWLTQNAIDAAAMDLLGTNRPTGIIQVFLTTQQPPLLVVSFYNNNGRICLGSFSSWISLAPHAGNPRGLGVTDLDGDGLEDLYCFSDQGLWLFKQYLAAPYLRDVTAQWVRSDPELHGDLRSVSHGDVDGNGQVELVVLTGGPGASLASFQLTGVPLALAAVSRQPASPSPSANVVVLRPGRGAAGVAYGPDQASVPATRYLELDPVTHRLEPMDLGQPLAGVPVLAVDLDQDGDDDLVLRDDQNQVVVSHGMRRQLVVSGQRVAGTAWAGEYYNDIPGGVTVFMAANLDLNAWPPTPCGRSVLEVATMFPWFDGTILHASQVVGHAYALPPGSPPVTAWMQAVAADPYCQYRWSNPVKVELR